MVDSFCVSLGCLAFHTQKGLHWGVIFRAPFKVRGHDQVGVEGEDPGHSFTLQMRKLSLPHE